MPAASADELFAAVQRSHLVTVEQLQAFRQTLPQQPQTSADAASLLVRASLLTQWQADRLMAGQESFFLGKYRLLSPLGQGGMGAVFKAEHPGLRRIVAIKILDRRLSGNPETIARFYREIEAVAALQHPNIVEAYDAGAVGPDHFLVMEYVRGEDLSELLRRQPVLPIRLACDYIRQAAEGLEYVHQRGLVHRDIKPGNLFVALKNDVTVVKILDMGLATFGELAREDRGLTRTGQIMGTPDYIAPEQAVDSKSVDIRADIFSLGCTLYRMLTGQLPFPGRSVMEKLMARAQRDAEPVSLLRPELPPELASLVMRMVARSPDARPKTPGQVAAELQTLAQTGQLSSEDVDGATIILPETDQPPLAQPVPASEQHTPPEPRPDAAFGNFLSNLTSQARDGHSILTGSTAAVPGSEPAAVSRRSRHSKSGLWILASTGLAFAVVAALLLMSTQASARLKLNWPVDERQAAELQINGRKLDVPANGEIVLEFPEGGRFEITATRPGYRPFKLSERVGRGELRVISPTWKLTPESQRQSELQQLAKQADELRPSESSLVPDSEDAAALRRSLQDFQQRHCVTQEAVEAADLLTTFEWPVDQLERTSIAPKQLRLVGDGESSKVPEEVVAILGNARLMHEHGIVDVEYSPDGRMVATVAGDHTIRVWDATTGDMIVVLQAPGRTGGDAVAFTPDGRQLVVSVWDRLVAWSTTSWQVDVDYGQTGLQKFSLDFDSRGRLFATTKTGAVQIWELGDQARLLHAFDVGGEFTSFAVSPDDRLIAIGNSLEQVRICSTEDYRVLAQFSLTHANGLMQFSNSGDRLVTCGGHSGTRCWDVRDPTNPIELSHYPSFNANSDFSRDGKHVFVTGWDISQPTLQVVETETGDAIGSVGSDPDSVTRHVRVSPDGKSAVTTSYSAVRFWDLATGEEKFVDDSEARAGLRHRDRLVDLDVSHDGTEVFSTALDMTVIRRSLATGEPLQLLRGPNELAGGIASYPQGKMFAYGEGSQLVFVGDRNVADWSGIGRVPGPYYHIEFSADGRHIAAGTMVSALRIRDSATGQLKREIEHVREFAFRADGLLAVAHGEPATISLHSDNGMKPVATLETDADIAVTLAFTPHGNELACVLYRDGSYLVEVWDVENRKRLRRFRPGQSLSFGAVDISPNGRLLARMQSEGNLTVWNLSGVSDTPVMNLSLGSNAVWCPRIRFTPDGRHILVGRGNGTILVVRLSPGITKDAGRSQPWQTTFGFDDE